MSFESIQKGVLPIEYKSFADRTCQIGLSDEDMKSTLVAKENFSEEESALQEGHGDLGNYKIIPEPMSFWKWLGQLFVAVLTLGCVNATKENVSIKERFLDEEAMLRFDKESQIIDEFIDEALKEDPVWIDLICEFSDDITTKSSGAFNNQNQEFELDLVYVLQGGKITPGDELTKKAMHERLNTIKTHLYGLTSEHYQKVQRKLFIGTLQREFGLSDAFNQAIAILDEAVEKGNISLEDRNAVILAYSSPDAKSCEMLLASVLKMKNPHVSTALEAMQKIVHFQHLTLEQREVFYLLTRLSEPAYLDRSFKSPNLNRVIDWFKSFTQRYEGVMQAKVQVKIEDQLSQLEFECDGEHFKLDGGFQIQPPMFLGGHGGIQEKIETKIHALIKANVESARKAASSQYPHLAEFKAFEEVFGDLKGGEGVAESQLLKLVYDLLFPVEIILKEHASSEEHLSSLRKEFNPSKLKGLIKDVYEAEFKEKHIALANHAEEYLNLVEERALAKLTSAIHYHVGELVRVALMQHAALEDLEDEEALKTYRKQFYACATIVTANGLAEWLAVYPDLADRKEEMAWLVGSDWVAAIVDKMITDATESQKPLEILEGMYQNHQAFLIEDKIEQLFTEHAGSIVERALKGEMLHLQEACSNEAEKKYMAAKNLFEARFDIAREFHNSMSKEINAFLKDTLMLQNTQHTNRFVDQKIAEVMEKTLARLVDESAQSLHALAVKQMEDASTYFSEKIDQWLQLRLKQQPVLAAGKMKVEADYDALALLVFDPQADKAVLVDDEKISLSKASEHMLQEYLKLHPDLISIAAKGVSRSVLMKKASQMISQKLSVLKRMIDLQAAKEVLDFVQSFGRKSAFDRVLEGLVAQKFGSAEEALAVLENPDDHGKVFNELCENVKKALDEHIDAQQITTATKEHLKEMFQKKVLLAVVKRVVHANICMAVAVKLYKQRNEFASLDFKRLLSMPGMAQQLAERTEKLKGEIQKNKNFGKRAYADKVHSDFMEKSVLFRTVVLPLLTEYPATKQFDLADPEAVAAAMEKFMGDTVKECVKVGLIEKTASEFIEEAAKKITSKQKVEVK